jgi:hypothetical protein
MKVFYRARAGKGETVYGRTGPVKFCCAEMCRQWGSLVDFGVQGAAWSTSRDVSLQTLRPQVNGRSVREVTPIQVCPWCGQPVEVCRVK